jgi:hypothetical protein
MLTTITAARERLGLPDTKDDIWLTIAIGWATGIFEKVCNRQFGRVSGALQEFDACDQSILLRRYPVESVSLFSLRVGYAWMPQNGARYDFDGPSGVVHIYAPLGTEGQRARVLYTGGYVLPGNVIEADSGQTELPTEIQGACLEQVAYWYQRRDQLGLGSIATGGGSVSQSGTMRLLPIVEETLIPHRRIRMT